jgi:hypothetical protein
MEAQKKAKSSKYTTEISNLYAGGLITIDIVFLQNLSFTGAAVKPEELLTAISLAVALPALAGILVVNTIQTWYPYRPRTSVKNKLLQMVFLLGIVSSITGQCGAYWSLSALVTIAFLCSLLLTTFVAGLYIASLSRKPE